MTSLRILAVSHRYPPYVAGGYELRTRDVVEGLRKRGHQVCVLTGRGSELEGQDGLCPVLKPDLDETDNWFQHSFDTSNAERFQLHFFRFANWMATRSAISRERPDLLLYFNLSMLSLAPVLAARHLSVPTLGDVSDPWPLNHWVLAWREREEGQGRSTAGRRALEQAWRGFRALADLGPMLVPSEYLKERFAADGISADEVRVMPTAVSPESFPVPDRAEPLPRTEGDPLRILSTSSFWTGKAVHVLVEGAIAALRRGCPLELVLAGDGDPDYKAELVERVRASGFTEQIRFAGTLTRDQIAEELGRSHIFGFPSAWGEPFSRATLEAMSHAVCVLARNAGANPEQVRHAEDGWLVDSEDPEEWAEAIEALARDEGRRASLARAGRRRFVEEYDFERYLDAYEAACHEAVAGGAR